MRGAFRMLCLIACVPLLAAPQPSVLPAGGEATGFEQALTVRALEFPRDHGPHPQFRQEWWYLTGNLDSADGGRFGFELTFFRFALAPPVATEPQAASAWRAREIYMAHFAITDLARAHFRFAQKLSRAALRLAGAENPPLDVWIDDWSLKETAPGKFRICAQLAGYALELLLTPQGPPVANGVRGLSVKSSRPGDASYYYSVPRLTASGQLRRDGVPLAVSGLAWLDREWGSGGLAPQQAGWDWFALQLSDGSALMFYALRDTDGRRDPHSAGTFVSADGQVRALAASEVAVSATGNWSDAQGVRYPVRWHLEVPSLSLAAEIGAILPAQELLTSPRYWEGAVDVRATRAATALTGRGYVELTGYERERSGR
jgi:predicted secreted hydrolase